MTHRTSQALLRTRRAAVAPTLLALVAAGLAVLPGLGVAASAATTQAGDVARLQTALGGPCTNGDLVQVTAAISGSGAELSVTCDITLDLAGHDVSVRNVIVQPGRTLAVTDNSVTSAAAGTLTADASRAFGFAGIAITGATLEVSGVAHVMASAYVQGAGIGGTYETDGGTVITRDSSTIDAVGGDGGAGIGGGNGGVGGTTTAYDDSTITATGTGGGAGIGGGTLGAGGTTTTYDSSTVVAIGGSQGAGIGSGRDGRRNAGQPGGTLATYDASSVTATGGSQAAGIGGGYYGYGGTTTTNDASTVTATGGFSGSGIGGGQNGAGGTTILRGSSVVTASTPDATSAIGDGPRGSGFGSLLVTDHAILRLPVGRLDVPDTATTPSGVEVTVTAEATITGSGGPAPTSAELTGPGQIDNGGTITLPTSAVGADLAITDHHYDVTFDAAGGALDPATVNPTRIYAATFARGERALPTHPTRDGYVFAGWNTAADGTGQTITATTPLPGSSTDGDAVPVRVYAQWGPAPLPVLPSSGLRVDGTPQVGVPITATFTDPSVDGLIVNWAWSVGGTPIPGTNRATYTPTADQVGQVLEVAVSLTATGYASRYDRVLTRPVIAAPVLDAPLPDPQLTLVGTPLVGIPLTATITRPDVGGIQVTWAWSVDGSPIPGADQATYTPTSDQVGRRLTVAVTLSAPGRVTRTERATTEPVVEPTAPALDLQVEGTPQVGRVLRASSADPVASDSGATWQWAVVDGAAATDIPGATAAAFTPTAAQLGRRLRVTLTVTGAGQTRTASGETDIVARGVLSTPSVRVRGSAQENRVLRAVATLGERPAGSRVSYAWRADGRRLAGRVHTSARTLTPRLVGKRITVTVTVSAPGYRKVRTTSPATPRVRGARSTYLARTPDPTAPGRRFVVYGHGPTMAVRHRLTFPGGQAAQARTWASGSFERTVGAARFCRGLAPRTRTSRLAVTFLGPRGAVLDRDVLYVRC